MAKDRTCSIIISSMTLLEHYCLYKRTQVRTSLRNGKQNADRKQDFMTRVYVNHGRPFRLLQSTVVVQHWVRSGDEAKQVEASLPNHCRNWSTARLSIYIVVGLGNKT